MGFMDFVRACFKKRNTAVEPTLDFIMREDLSKLPATNYSLRALLILDDETRQGLSQNQLASSIKKQLDAINEYVKKSSAEEAFFRPPYTCQKGGYVLKTVTMMGLLGLGTVELFIYSAASLKEYEKGIGLAPDDYHNIRVECPNIFSLTNGSCHILPYESVCVLSSCAHYDHLFEICRRQLFNSEDNCSNSIAMRMPACSPSNYPKYEGHCSNSDLNIGMFLAFLAIFTGVGTLIMPCIILSSYKNALMKRIMDRSIEVLEDGDNLSSAESGDQKINEGKVITIGFAKSSLQLMFSKAKQQTQKNSQLALSNPKTREP